MSEHFQSRNPFPNFVFRNRKLYVGQSILDLSGRPQMAKIVALFVEEKNRTLNKSELIAKIYCPKRQVSLRLSESYRGNIVKMLSRARKMMTRISPEEGGDFTWFPYDRKRKNWVLCQYTPRNPHPPCQP